MITKEEYKKLIVELEKKGWWYRECTSFSFAQPPFYVKFFLNKSEEYEAMVIEIMKNKKLVVLSCDNVTYDVALELINKKIIRDIIILHNFEDFYNKEM